MRPYLVGKNLLLTFENGMIFLKTLKTTFFEFKIIYKFLVCAPYSIRPRFPNLSDSMLVIANFHDFLFLIQQWDGSVSANGATPSLMFLERYLETRSRSISCLPNYLPYYITTNYYYSTIKFYVVPTFCTLTCTLVEIQQILAYANFSVSLSIDLQNFVGRSCTYTK